jgi:hypothetical protein
MAELKTKATTVSLDEFLSTAVDATRHDDCRAIAAMMQRATGDAPIMWGPSIVGFGRTLVAYANGKSTEWMLIGFSPRKSELVLYGLLNTAASESLLAKLGKHKTGKGCLYIKRLSDVDIDVLNTLIKGSVKASGAQRVKSA